MGYGEVPVHKLFDERLEKRRVLLVGTKDSMALITNPRRIPIEPQANTDKHAESSHSGRDIKAQSTPERRRSECVEGLLPGMTPQQLQRFIGEHIARNHEEYCHHDMARYQHVDNGQLMDAPVLLVKPPSHRGFMRVCEEEMEVEDQQTGPSSQAVERSD